MKAAFIDRTGPPDVIQWGEVATPVPGPDQVLVRTGAVAVNPIDTYIRNGANYWELPLPFIIGCDVAGQVEAVGANVTRFKVGDRVWGSNQGLLGRQGSFAEYCCSDANWLYPTPDNVSDENAAAIALVGITAHLGLFHRAQLRAGETVFVQGGSGGVGSTVIQMAKAAGARVIASAGSAEKGKICRALGADDVVFYREANVVEQLQRSAPQGINVFWETRREPDFDAIVPCMAERGRIILMAGRDARPQFPVGPFYVKGCSLLGFVMFKATPDEQRNCATDINRWLTDGSLRPRIDRVMPMSQSAEAHRLQEQATVHHAVELAGKIVLVVD